MRKRTITIEWSLKDLLESPFGAHQSHRMIFKNRQKMLYMKYDHTVPLSISDITTFCQELREHVHSVRASLTHLFQIAGHRTFRSFPWVV
uniref:Ovule protein n=1 Tax=Steinernema glaseri TaxID=37863 RepID=A0A1I8AR27_9BILA